MITTAIKPTTHTATTQAPSQRFTPSTKDGTAVANPVIADGLAPLHKKSTFAGKHPLLTGLGITWAACSGAGAIGMATGFAVGGAIKKGLIRTSTNALVQGRFSAMLVGTAVAGTVGLVAGAAYAAHRR